MANTLEVESTDPVGRDSRYDVKDFSYPNDLFADQRYGGNYVVFYINASVDSKLVRDLEGGAGPNSGAGFVEAVDRIRSPYVESQIRRGATVNSTTGAAAASAGAGGFVLRTLGLGGGASGGAALLGAAAAGAINTTATTATRAQKRLQTAIALHVPNQLQIRYGMQWSEEDTFNLEALQSAGNETLEALSSGSGSAARARLGNALDIAASKAFASGPFASNLSSATGLASNPKKEQIFKGVNFRDFTFEYQFFPRDAQEAANVENIIWQFKYHMHPEFKDPNAFLFVYPAEFDISYFMNGVENPHIHKHASCVLTDMNINYTPNGVFSTFDNGMPTQINVTMSFKELALITKEKLGEGPGEGL